MLAATLLLTHADEEQAFWVLVAILDRLLPTSFFSPDLLASRADQLVLEELLVQHIPKVAHHLLELGVDLASITFGWLLSLFTDCLPVEVRSTDDRLADSADQCRLCSESGTSSSLRDMM